MQGDEQLVDILKSLEEDQIDSPSSSAPICVWKHSSRSTPWCSASRKKSQADQRCPPRSSHNSLPGQLRRLPINFIHTVGKSMPSQLDAFAAKVLVLMMRAGLHIVGVNFSDQVGTGDAECLDTFVRRGAAFLEQRSDGSVSTKRMSFDCLKKGHCLCHLSGENRSSAE